MAKGRFMNITKYEHACFTVEKDGQALVVDPGNWTTDFIVPENVVGIVITHGHADHFDKTHISAILDKNPDAVIISDQSIIDQLGAPNAKPVVVGEPITIGAFMLDFFGGDHATIHPSIPTLPNTGVMINDQIYYPGDSFAIPTKPVAVLALPVSAPWLKFSETIDFLVALKPKVVFPTHDAILSDTGKALADRLASEFTQQVGGRYERINGKTISA